MLKQLAAKSILVICLLTFLFFFYRFTFNSGYGYDALENMVIGRSLLHGYPLYTFVPSKSWGMYYLVALFLSAGRFSNHYGISLLVTLIYAATLLLTFLIIKRKFNLRVALLSSALVGLCGIFMELNYLISEGLVYIFGLVGYYFASSAIISKKKQDLFLGGFWIGVSFAFKSTAGFYFLAVACFLLFWGRRANKPLVGVIKDEFWLSLGFFATLIIPVFYFAYSGRLREYWEWTYYFPLFKFPPRLDFFYKLYTKLLWFNILFIVTFLLSFKASLRKLVAGSPNTLLLIFMGLFSLAPLLKYQPSHYLFPAASFLCIYLAAVSDAGGWLKHVVGNRMRFILMALAIVITVIVSVYLYSPLALKRLSGINDYSYEENIKAFIQKNVPVGKHAIFFKNSMFLYWVSERYPNIAFINSDVNATYGMEKKPGLLLDALLDPNLVLVEFNRQSTGIMDERFHRREKNRDLLRQFYASLNSRFSVLDAGIAPYTFWKRNKF